MSIESLPTELILLLGSFLPTASLGALTATCSRQCDILQSQLEARITPTLAQELLIWAAAAYPRTVKKLLAPPHLLKPSEGYGSNGVTPLHIAAQAGNLETAALLLAAGADANLRAGWEGHTPLYHAVANKDRAMAALLLDNGARVDLRWGCDGMTETALHRACARGDLEMVRLLLARGANPERHGHHGTALGFAVYHRQVAVVRLLLDVGADVTLTVPLFVLFYGQAPLPHNADLLYLAMGLRHPGMKHYLALAQDRNRKRTLAEDKRELMAMLMAYGASKDATIAAVSKQLVALAKEVDREPHEYLAVIKAILKEAEDAIPDVLEKYK